MICSSILWLSAALTLVLITECHPRGGPLPDDVDIDDDILEQFLLRRARVEEIKRGILEQLGLTEAPLPPSERIVHNRTSDGDNNRRRSHRLDTVQPRQHSVSNDVIIGDITGNEPRSAKQFYSFKGHATPGSGGCDASSEHTLFFRVDIPEPTLPGVETVVSSATLRLYARRRRRNHAKSPVDDIALVTVYQLHRHADGSDNETAVTSRAVRTRDETGARSWEEFDVTSAVEHYVTLGGGKSVGLLRLKVKVTGAQNRSRRHVLFGDDWCDDIRQLRHRHHPVLNVLTQDRLVRRRRTRRSVFPDAGPSPPSVDEPCTAGDGETRCCRQQLWISFREIGWDDWIIAPDGYQAYYCYGACPPGHRTAHNHAAVRVAVLEASAAGTSSRTDITIPRPACTGTRLGSLRLTHYLHGRRVVSIFNDMIVEQCQCA